MAKVCINCGKKISLGEKAYRMKETSAYLCVSCGCNIMPLVDDLLNAVNLESFRSKKAEVTSCMRVSKVTEKAKTYIDYEISSIADKMMNRFAIDFVDCMTFEADFQESYNLVRRSCSVQPLSKPLIIETGDTKVVTFLYEDYCYDHSDPCISVTLIHRDGKAYVTAQGTDGGISLSNSGKRFLQKFWQTFITQSSHIKIEDYPARTLDDFNSRAIGVLGGTFDPVHNGHVTLAQAALTQGNLKKLIVMPAHVQPFKLGKKISEDHHRLEMTKLAFDGMPEVEVSDYEIEHTDISYTYETLCRLQEIYPDDEIAFIMGTDSFLNLDTWYMGRELLENFSFLVSVRPGYRESELEQKIEEFRRLYETKVEKLVMEMPDISSTEIRRRYEAGLSNTGNVPDSVERYIDEHGLYK